MEVQDLDANLVGECFRLLRNRSDPREGLGAYVARERNAIDRAHLPAWIQPPPTRQAGTSDGRSLAPTLEPKEPEDSRKGSRHIDAVAALLQRTRSTWMNPWSPSALSRYAPPHCVRDSVTRCPGCSGYRCELSAAIPRPLSRVIRYAFGTVSLSAVTVATIEDDSAARPSAELGLLLACRAIARRRGRSCRRRRRGGRRRGSRARCGYGGQKRRRCRGRRIVLLHCCVDVAPIASKPLVRRLELDAFADVDRHLGSVLTKGRPSSDAAADHGQEHKRRAPDRPASFVAIHHWLPGLGARFTRAAEAAKHIYRGRGEAIHAGRRYSAAGRRVPGGAIGLTPRSGRGRLRVGLGAASAG